MSNNLIYLRLLEASQSAFESSKKGLKAAEEAFNAAKIVNVEAKAALDAATEAFKATSCQTSKNEKTSTPLTQKGEFPEHENADPDGSEDDFTKLSTNKNPPSH